MDGLMSIGEFAAMSGLSPRRLRSYAVAGLLAPAAVDSDSSYRYYSASQLPDAQLIDVLRRAGMPLAEIKAVLGDRSLRRVESWAGQIRSDAARKQEAVAQARELLAAEANEAELLGKDAETMKLQTAGRSETGTVRERNEDAIVVGDNLVAVADGMGGHPGGQVASALAASALSAIFTGRSAEELATAVRAANWSVWERARNDADLQGMGTTMCAVGRVGDGAVAIANVGDSRAYLARDGSIQVLTNDHTVTAELVRKGALTPQEATDHPHRRLLTRALGVNSDVIIDTMCLELVAGDRLLLCSDGVFGNTSDEKLAELLQGSDTAQTAANAVVEHALANGSDDNASAVAAFVTA